MIDIALAPASALEPAPELLVEDVLRAPGESLHRGTRNRIVLCLPELSLALSLRHNLELDGHQVEYTHDPAPLSRLLRLSRAQLLVISHAAFEQRADRLLAGLRGEGLGLPVLVLATRPVEASEYPGFRLGIDEFLLRPATVAELHGTLERMLNRIPAEASPDQGELLESIIRFGRVTVLPRAHAVQRDGKDVRLGLKEFGVLMTLIRRSGRIVTRQELLRQVWGFKGPARTRTVDTHITKLRGKLEDTPHEPRHILTVRNVGYRFEAGQL